MSDWTVDIPCRDPDEPLNLWTILEVTHELDDPTERNMASYLLERLSNEYRAETFGDALSLIGRADPAGRRRLLDDARAEAGLEATGEIDRARELAAVRRDDPPEPPSLASSRGRDNEGRAFQSCPVQDCLTVPCDGTTSKPIPVKARKWWCPNHAHLAAEGDMDDWTGPGLRFSPGGGIERVLTEEDEAFYRAIDQRREDDDEERRQQREADAKVAAAARERWRRERMDIEGPSIAGVRPSQVRW